MYEMLGTGREGELALQFAKAGALATSATRRIS